MRTLLSVLVVVLAVVVVVPTCHAATLKLPAAPTLEVSGPAARTIAVVLHVPDELRSQEYVVKTSPFDRIRYPVGEYTVALLERNLGRAFDAVRVAEGSAAVEEAAAVVTLTIESFEAVIPSPAYKPYTADVVYRVTVRDPAGESVFTQTVTGSAQTSKGMMSGFKAKGLAAEAAARAMNDAMTQLLEGLLEASELADLELPVTSGGVEAAVGEDGAS